MNNYAKELRPMKGQQTLFSGSSDEWSTPEETFQALDTEFHFTLDPCATDQNHKCALYYTQKENGLLQNWGGPKRILQSAVLRNRCMGGEGIP
jgi:phage N-6-adenine-methyltransferase